ncbi:FKBP-type peptidyl-prolyl cis-trans isomerase [Tenacibaculum soleae]|uniref:Peptidyl-prolyl cis-trans isomerase n=1 Tax=Tenacibaculum soleae TaxID=447689 RepID=A0A1B9Y2Z4_9FLAO|nr:FKBP-type peptidyl-prolyl cis-trans isomerase [Tenacibaculum soleae]MDO6813054.1 FKBP-type peptidyl-prolyl cis-trans isomerase [Tenacibaculum soleae]OCK44162.1 peptidylprolyl isomerase [Tenacibaculum soleae]
MKMYFYIVLVALFMSCSSDDDINYDAKNEADIVKYIADNNLSATKSNSGLYYIISSEGNGTRPTVTSNVKVAYKGYFLNGDIFDQNTAGVEFNLQEVIKGWTEGITYFKEGGKGVLLVPSKLGYGSNGRSGIPGGSVLIFDINLLEVN